MAGFDGSVNCWIPRVPIQQRSETRLRIAKMGDGYEQRILDGINANEIRFNLVFETLPNAELIAMDDYLKARKGAAFPFEHPMTGVLYNVFCDEWNINWDMHLKNRPAGVPSDYGTLTAEFRVANGVGVTVIP